MAKAMFTLSLVVPWLVALPPGRAQSLITDTIALIGDPVPDSELTIRTLSEAAIDASGRIVFRDTDSRVRLIFQSTRTAAGLIRIPDVPPGFTVDADDPLYFGFSVTELYRVPIVNAAGTLAFTASVSSESGSFSAPSVLFRGTSVTALNNITRADMLDLPGLSDPEIPVTVFAEIVGHVLNASGTSAFVTRDFGAGSGGWPGFTGIFIAAGGAPARIALAGEQAPDTPAGAVSLVNGRRVAQTVGATRTDGLSTLDATLLIRRVPGGAGTLRSERNRWEGQPLGRPVTCGPAFATATRREQGRLPRTLTSPQGR